VTKESALIGFRIYVFQKEKLVEGREFVDLRLFTEIQLLNRLT